MQLEGDKGNTVPKKKQRHIEMKHPWFVSIASLTLLCSTASCNSSTNSGKAKVYDNSPGFLRNDAPVIQDGRIRLLGYSELRNLFADRAYSGTTPQSREWKAIFELPNISTIEWVGPNSSGRDQGTWYIENNLACIQWRFYDDGKINCRTIYQVSVGQYNIINDNGSLYSHMSVTCPR